MILLLGASGYVGRAYQKYFTEQGLEFFAADRTHFDYLHLDGLNRLIDSVKPRYLINAAGYVGRPNVDACEVHKTVTLIANAVLPGILLQLCTERKLPWGTVSSGCIFNGSQPHGAGFREKDPPNFTFRSNNCSFYSGTKGLAEEMLAGAPLCYVWRLRLPFNHVDFPRNYLSKMMTYSRLLEARNSLSQLDEFVRATWESLRREIPCGVYNVTNPGSVTTSEVVALIKKSPAGRVLLRQGKKFSFFTDEEEFLRTTVKVRRASCVLDSGKLLRAGIVMTEVHEAMEKALQSWVWDPNDQGSVALASQLAKE